MVQTVGDGCHGESGWKRPRSFAMEGPRRVKVRSPVGSVRHPDEIAMRWMLVVILRETFVEVRAPMVAETDQPPGVAVAASLPREGGNLPMVVRGRGAELLRSCGGLAAQAEVDLAGKPVMVVAGVMMLAGIEVAATGALHGERREAGLVTEIGGGTAAARSDLFALEVLAEAMVHVTAVVTMNVIDTTAATAMAVAMMTMVDGEDAIGGPDFADMC